jgi:cysteine desulfurase / selenocysteine lyase
MMDGTRPFRVYRGFAGQMERYKPMEQYKQNPVFLDHAGSSRPSDVVVQRQYRHLRLEQMTGGYAAAQSVSGEIASVRETLGGLVGADGSSVALGESSSVLWARALGLVSLKPGSKVIVTSHEYGSNLISLAAQVDRYGLLVQVVEAEVNGQVPIDEFMRALEDGPPSLVALCHIPTGFGIAVDIRPLVSVAKRAGALVFIDACQSVGQMDTEWLMEEADVVVCSGRKFIEGPRGTGFAAVSQNFLEHVQITDADICGARLNGRLQLRVESPLGLLERWEGNVSGVVGLGVAAQETIALDYALEYDRRTQLGAGLRDALQNLKHVKVLEPNDAKSSTTTFVVGGTSPSEIVARCRAEGAIISEVETYTAPLDLPKRVGGDVNRVSFGRRSTEADIYAFASVLKMVISATR